VVYFNFTTRDFWEGNVTARSEIKLKHPSFPRLSGYQRRSGNKKRVDITEFRVHSEEEEEKKSMHQI
jgi:hypothetical protein